MKNKTPLSNLLRPGMLALFLAAFFTSLMAQDSATATTKTKYKNKWAFLVEPYFMFPTMNGTTGIGDLPNTEIDADPGDIFSHFQIGYMINLEASYGRWVITTDEIYMNLKQDAKPGTLINHGEIKAKQFVWEVGGMYKLSPIFDVGIGSRLNSIKLETDIVRNTQGGGTVEEFREVRKTWLDPLIVARLKSRLSSKFIYQLRADIGGFGIASDFTWQVQAYLGYRFSKLFEMTAGYRVLSTDYSKGSGEDRFLYDVDTFGPAIRAGFNF